MKEEKEIISEYFTNYYPQKRTIVLNEVGPFAPMGAGVVGGTAGEVAGTLSSGANIAGSVIGFGGLAIIALIIFFLIRGTKQDYGYVTGNVRDPGTYREMTSTLDTMINGKISPEDKEALQNYKQDLNDFQKEDQKILNLLKQLSVINQDGFDKKTIYGIDNLSDILLKIGEKKQTADQEIKIRNIVLQIQKDNIGKPVLQQICRDILDSLKNKEEIIKRSTGYQKLILKLSTKFPKLSDSLLSKLMFGTGKEDSLDLIKKAREFESNKKKQAEFLKNKEIPFQIEKIDDETGIKIKIAYDNDKKDGNLKINDGKVEIKFNDSSLSKKFKEEHLIIKEGQEFLLSFLDLENEYTVFYEDFLNKFNGEIAEIKNFKIEEENLKNLKSVIATYINPDFLEKIKEYSESSKETKNKDVDFEKQLEAQIKDLAKKVIDFLDKKLEQSKTKILSTSDKGVFSTSKKIDIQDILKLRNFILYKNPKNELENKYNSFFININKNIIDYYKIVSSKLSSFIDKKSETIIQDNPETAEEIKRLKQEVANLNKLIESSKTSESIDTITANTLEIISNVEKLTPNQEEPTSSPEEKKENPDKIALIQKLKQLKDNKNDKAELKQNIVLNDTKTGFKIVNTDTDTYIKFLKGKNLEIYSKKEQDDIPKEFEKDTVVLESAENKDKLIFKGEYTILGEKQLIFSKLKRVDTEEQEQIEEPVSEEDKNELIKELKLEKFSNGEYIVSYDSRIIILKKFNNGFIVPFYISTGMGQKNNVPKGKWYSFLGFTEKDSWFIKGNNQEAIFKKFYIKELQDFAKELDEKLGDLSQNNTYKEVELKDIINDCNKSFKDIPVQKWIDSDDWQKRYELLYEKFGKSDVEIGKLITKIMSNDLSDDLLNNKKNKTFYLKLKENKTFIISNNKKNAEYVIFFNRVKAEDWSEKKGKFKITSKEKLTSDKISDIINKSTFEEIDGESKGEIEQFSNEAYVGTYKVDGFEIKILDVEYKGEKQKNKTNLVSDIGKLTSDTDCVHIDVNVKDDLTFERSDKETIYKALFYKNGTYEIRSTDLREYLDPKEIDDLQKNIKETVFENENEKEQFDKIIDSYQIILYSGAYKIENDKIVISTIEKGEDGIFIPQKSNKPGKLGKFTGKKDFIGRSFLFNDKFLEGEYTELKNPKDDQNYIKIYGDNINDDTSIVFEFHIYNNEALKLINRMTNQVKASKLVKIQESKKDLLHNLFYIIEAQKDEKFEDFIDFEVKSPIVVKTYITDFSLIEGISFSVDRFSLLKKEIIQKLKEQSGEKKESIAKKPQLDGFLLKNHFIFKGNELQPTTEKLNNKSHITFKLLQADTQKGFDTRYEITTIVKKDDAEDSLSLIYKEDDLVITTKDLITERSKSNLFSKLITIFEKEGEQLNEIDFLISEMSKLNFDYESQDTVNLGERIIDKGGKFIITDFFKKQIREDIAKKIFDKRLDFFEKQIKDKKTYKELSDFETEIEDYRVKFRELRLITDDFKGKISDPSYRLIDTFKDQMMDLAKKKTEISQKIEQYKKVLKNLYESNKKYSDLNGGQKRLINLISVRNEQLFDNNPLIKDFIETDFKEVQDLIDNNGSSKSLKNTPSQDFFEKLDEKVKDINVTKIGEQDYLEGESKEQEDKKESNNGTGDTEFEITNASNFSFFFNDTEIAKDQKITIKLSKKDDFYFCINNNVELRQKNKLINFINPSGKIPYTSAEIKFDKDDDDFTLALSEDSADTVFLNGKSLDSAVGETIDDEEIRLQLAPDYILKIKKLTQSNEEEKATIEGFTSKELFEELENYVTENGKKVPKNWSIHSFFIKKQQNKIIFLKKETSDFYIILKNSDNFIYPFVIYKRKKSEDQIDLDNTTSLFEASMLDTFLDKIDLALHKNYKKEDIPIYQGEIEINKDKDKESYTVKFIKIEKIEEDPKKSSDSQTVKTEPSNNIILTAAQKIANLFKFTDKKTSEQEKKEIAQTMQGIIKDGQINPEELQQLKDEANIQQPQDINLNINPANTESTDKELEFSNTEKLILDKDFNISTEESSGITFGFDDKNNNIWILNNTGNEISMKIGALTKTIFRDFNIFWGRAKEKDENVDKKTSMFIAASEVPKDLSFEVGKKAGQMFKKQKTISFKYIVPQEESYKNKKNIKYFFEQIFIKEIKKEFFYNEQENADGIEKEKEVAEIKTQDDLMDYLFPSNVYKIDLDVGNKIQQENNFSEDALEEIKNGIIFYKRKDENFYRGQLKISDLSIFYKNEDLLKTYFNFYKNSEKIKNVLSEESKKLVEDIKHPDIMSGNYCQVQIDAVTSVINNKITTDYKITVLKKGIVSSDKFTEKFKTIDKEKEKDLISKLKDVVKKDLEEKEEEKPEEINQKEEIVPPKEEVSSEQYFISLDDIKNKKKIVSDTVKSDIGIIFTKNKQNFTGYLWIKQLNKVDDLIGFNEIIALRDYFNFNLQDFIINEEININDYKSGFISDNSLTVTIVNNEITSVINKGNVKNEYYTRLEKSKQELLKTEIEKTNKEAAYKKFGLTDLLIREKAQEQITESPTGFIAKKESSKEGILIPKNYKNIDIMLSKDGYKVYYYIKNGEDYYYIDVNEKLFYILNVIIRGLKFFFGASNTLITVDKEIANSEIKLKDLKTILKVTKVAQDKNIKKMKFKFGKIEEKITKANKTFFKFPLNTSMQPKIGDGKEQEQGNQTAVPQTEEFFENLIIKNIWKK